MKLLNLWTSMARLSEKKRFTRPVRLVPSNVRLSASKEPAVLKETATLLIQRDSAWRSESVKNIT